MLKLECSSSSKIYWISGRLSFLDVLFFPLFYFAFFFMPSRFFKTFFNACDSWGKSSDGSLEYYFITSSFMVPYLVDYFWMALGAVTFISVDEGGDYPWGSSIMLMGCRPFGKCWSVLFWLVLTVFFPFCIFRESTFLKPFTLLPLVDSIYVMDLTESVLDN